MGFSDLAALAALQGQGDNGNALDASYVAAGAAILAAAIAGLAAVFVYERGQRAAANDRKRETCGKAIADALAWMELPYRIRRRLDNDPETLRAMANRIHTTQESLLFYQSWLRVELPEAYDHYAQLVSALKATTRTAMQDAWETEPSAAAADMNIGELTIDRTLVDEALSRLTATIRQHFG